MDGLLDPTTALELDRTFAVDRATLFDAFLDPAMLRRIWSTARNRIVEMTVDARVGGGWALAMRDERTGAVTRCAARFVEVNRPIRIVWQSAWFDGPHAAVGETRVTLDFAQAGGDTRLRLRHELIPDHATRDRFAMEWSAEFARLGQLLAGETMN